MRLVLHEAAGQNAIPMGASVWDLSVAEICNAGDLEVFGGDGPGGVGNQVHPGYNVDGFSCESQALNGGGENRAGWRACGSLRTEAKGGGPLSTGRSFPGERDLSKPQKPSHSECTPLERAVRCFLAEGAWLTNKTNR